MHPTPIKDLIPETNIVVFAPHYDDFLFGLGGYALEMRAQGLLSTKRFHILLLFSTSNYQAGSGALNFDTSLDRLKLATGNRLMEDIQCLDELLGEHYYRYELLRERECFVRAKPFSDSEMEFPHGMYADFDDADRQIFARLQSLVEAWAGQPDTAMVFPLAIKEHIDHFLTREAGITIARRVGSRARARFYFQEDKPYAGIQTEDERQRIEAWVRENNLDARLYRGHAGQVVELAFKHYISQVEDIYRTGILNRPAQLNELYGIEGDIDRLFIFR